MTPDDTETLEEGKAQGRTSFSDDESNKKNERSLSSLTIDSQIDDSKTKGTLFSKFPFYDFSPHPWVPENIRALQGEGKAIFFSQERESAKEKNFSRVTQEDDIDESLDDKIFETRLQVASYHHSPGSNVTVLALQNKKGKTYDVVTSDFSERDNSVLKESHEGKNSIYLVQRKNSGVGIEPAEGQYYDNQSLDGKKTPLALSAKILGSISTATRGAVGPQFFQRMYDQVSQAESVVRLTGTTVQEINSLYITGPKNDRHLHVNSHDSNYYIGVNLTNEQTQVLMDAAKSGDRNKKGVYIASSSSMGDFTVEPSDTTLWNAGGEIKNATSPHLFSARQKSSFLHPKAPCYIKRPTMNKSSYEWVKSHELQINGVPVSLLHDKNQKGYFLNLQVVVAGGKGGNELECFLPEKLLLPEEAKKIHSRIIENKHDPVSITMTPNAQLHLQFQSEQQRPREIKAQGADDKKELVKPYREYSWRPEGVSSGQEITSKLPYTLPPDYLKAAESAKVFWDITSQVTTLNKRQAEIDDMLALRGGDMLNYAKTGAVDRILTTDHGWYIDHNVGPVKRTLFTNIFNWGTRPPTGSMEITPKRENGEENPLYDQLRERAFKGFTDGAITNLSLEKDGMYEVAQTTGGKTRTWDVGHKDPFFETCTKLIPRDRPMEPNHGVEAGPNARALIDAACTSPRGSKTFKITWNNEEQSLHLQSTKELANQRIMAH